MSLMDQLFGNSNAFPKQQAPVVSPFGMGQKTLPIQPNFQTLSGQKISTGVYPATQNYMPPKSVGVQASAPEQNLSKPKVPLATSQQKTQTTTPVQGISATPNYNVNANFGGSITAPNLTGTQPDGTPVSQPQNQNPQTPQNLGGLYPQLIQQLQKSGTTPSIAYQDAQNKYQQAVDNLQRLKSGLATADANIEGQAIPLEFQQGREQIVNRQAASQLDAAQQAVTEQEQAMGYANTQQQTEQQALGTAAQYAQPQLGQYGQAYYSPLQAGGGQQGGVSPSDPFYSTLQGYAQMAANNQLSAIPSSITSNPVLNQQVLQMAKQINPNFDYNTALGSGNAAQTNAQVGGTAQTTAYQGIYNQAANDYANLTQSVGNVDQFGNLLLNTMKQGGIDPSDIRYANTIIKQIRNQLNSAQQSVFDSNLASLQQKASALLSAGGSEIPSQTTADIQSIINGNLTVGAMKSVLANINKEGNILQQNAYQKLSDAKSMLNQGTGTGSSNSSGGTINTKYGSINPNL